MIAVLEVTLLGLVVPGVTELFWVPVQELIAAGGGQGWNQPQPFWVKAMPEPRRGLVVKTFPGSSPRKRGQVSLAEQKLTHENKQQNREQMWVCRAMKSWQS